jgi:hypothetical protein
MALAWFYSPTIGMRPSSVKLGELSGAIHSTYAYLGFFATFHRNFASTPPWQSNGIFSVLPTLYCNPTLWRNESPCRTLPTPPGSHA